MIRIMTATKRNVTTITVDGCVIAEYTETIDAVVKQAIERGGPVHLFLRDVSTIDESGRALLRGLVGKRVRLSAAGVYCSYVVAGINRSATHPQAA